MRVYWPVTLSDITSWESGETITLHDQSAIAATEEFALTLETSDADELDLLAALSAGDLGGDAIGVMDSEVSVVDATLGEVTFSADVSINDIACFLIADPESQELSWFGVQEIDHLTSAISAKGK